MAGASLLLAYHLLLALALLAASLSHLLVAALAHLSPAQTTTHHRLRFLRHPLVRLLPVLAALPFPFLPVAPSYGPLPLLLLPPLLLPLPLPFLPPGHLPLLRPLFLSLPLLLLARAAGLLAEAFPASDLQTHALSVTALLLLVAAAASLLSSLSAPRTAHHFLAEATVAFAGAVGGLPVQLKRPGAPLQRGESIPGVNGRRGEAAMGRRWAAAMGRRWAVALELPGAKGWHRRGHGSGVDGRRGGGWRPVGGETEEEREGRQWPAWALLTGRRVVVVRRREEWCVSSSRRNGGGEREGRG